MYGSFRSLQWRRWCHRLAQYTLKINVRVRLHVGAPLAAHVALILHVPLILKAKVMAAQILQGDALKGLLAPWFVPPIVIPIMLAALIVGSALYRAYS
jgi:hypothetical protein